MKHPNRPAFALVILLTLGTIALGGYQYFHGKYLSRMQAKYERRDRKLANVPDIDVAATIRTRTPTRVPPGKWRTEKL